MRKSLFIFVFACLSSIELQAGSAPLLHRFHVCTAAPHGMPNLNKLSLSRKIHHHLKILGSRLPYLVNGSKLILTTKYLETPDDSEIVMFVDAFDVITVAEKNCYPKHLINKYPPRENPFKYINTGSYIGYVKNLKARLNDLPSVNPKISDQSQVASHYPDGRAFFDLDYDCELFLPLHSVENQEIDIDVDNRIVHCLTTNSEPCVIHANGKSFRIRDVIYQKLIKK